MQSLLAVDLGLKTGLAVYGDDGRLRWYRSHNFGSVPRMRKAVYRILKEIPDLTWIVAEGDRLLGEIWEKEGARSGARTRVIGAETWRPKLLLSREQRSGSLAKRYADGVARRIIEWSGAPRPTSLRHDAAEAILIGMWGVVELEWLKEFPAAIR
jgi:hypothetical protein